MTKYIFLYGTLKNGEYNDNVIKNLDLKFISNVKTLNKYQMYKNLNHSFPYLLDKKGNFQIEGELYELINEKKDLIKLDNFEGAPYLYYRDIIEVVNNEEKSYNCYVYFKTNPYEYEDLDKSEMIFKW